VKATKEGKCEEPFIYASKKSVTTNAPIATTLTVTKYSLVDISSSEFYQNSGNCRKYMQMSLRGF